MNTLKQNVDIDTLVIIADLKHEYNQLMRLASATQSEETCTRLMQIMTALEALTDE